jgi:dTDP-4-dehydrorhamnose 3,5-epimerase-like enzyme
MVQKPSARRIDLPQFIDERGDLVFCEAEHHIPFEIKRVFWIVDVPANEMRAGHAHKKCEQLVIAVSGGFYVQTDKVDPHASFHLSDPHEAIYIPAGVYMELYGFTSDAVCLVLASEHYSEEDYVRQNS